MVKSTPLPSGSAGLLLQRWFCGPVGPRVETAAWSLPGSSACCERRGGRGEKAVESSLGVPGKVKGTLGGWMHWVSNPKVRRSTKSEMLGPELDQGWGVEAEAWCEGRESMKTQYPSVMTLWRDGSPEPPGPTAGVSSFFDNSFSALNAQPAPL